MHDPGLRALRRAARTVVTATTAFLVGRYVVDDTQFAVMAAFAAIGVNGLADFGGPRRSRLVANLALVATGVPLVILGTWTSENTAVATALMFVVVFLAGFAGIYSGYLAAGANVVILLFVVANAIPAPADQIGSRLAGLVVGGALAVAGAELLWPLDERDRFRRLLAGALREQSAAVARAGEPGAHAPAGTPVAAIRAALAALPVRPAGPAGRDRGQINLVYAMGRLHDLLGHLVAAGRELGPTPRAELAALARSLERSADTLDGGPPVDAVAVRRHADAVAAGARARLEDLLAGDDGPVRLAAAADADTTLVAMARAGVAVAANALAARGLAVPAAVVAPGPGAPALDPTRSSTLALAWWRLRANLTPSSVGLENALRLATALALARLLVGVLDLQHGFWVVFGTLAVMKTNAGGTRATVARAVAGTAAGFVVGAALLTLLEGDAVAWVVILPVAVFEAMYVLGRSVVLGQALFTILVIVLFRIVVPADWTLALLRLEDVAVGAVVGLAIGVLAWPRGAGGGLRDAFATLYEAGGRYAAETGRAIFADGPPAGADPAVRAGVAGAWRRADDAFQQYLTEAGPRIVPMPVWGDLLERGLRLWVTTDAVRLHGPGGAASDPTCPDLARALRRASDDVGAAWAVTAAALHAGAPTHARSPFGSAPGPLAAACLAAVRAGPDRRGVARVADLVEARTWLHGLAEDLTGASGPVDVVGERLGPRHRPWWAIR